ncbi:FtsX-like permease family protein [Streptomyces smyrnaeus]|uniref:FtsX-like permease family protein n=1 Tax=Streptomyces smyrnaeus TaxID=1387713 RepID=UPI0036863234
MLSVALGTLRARWVSFLGTIAALVLAVAQLAALGVVMVAALQPPQRPPQRFAAAPNVVLPSDPSWDPAHHDLGVRSLTEAKGVPPTLVDKLAGTGRTIVDRTFYAQLARGPKNQVGHPWPVARFGGHTLRDGRAPRTDREIVVAAGRAHTGERVSVLTAAGPESYTVVGTVSPVDWEDAIFFTTTETARLSPRIDALVALGPPERVRAAVHEAGDTVQLLTGRARHHADAAAKDEREALDNTVTLLPVMATVAGTTAVFVVASTFAFSVVQRRREIALLRAVGAVGRQVRRMIYGEALLVGCCASALGSLLGLLATGPLTSLLIRMDIAPPWFDVGPASASWSMLAPLGAAFLTGVLVALGGAMAAAHRASRIQPMEALREAAVDDSATTPGRTVLGVAGIAGGLGTACWIGLAAPRTALSPTAYVVCLMVPVVATALLAPLVVGPLVRLLMWPLRRLPGPHTMLVRQSALAARRRTAATAAPVLLTVGLTLSLLTATNSLGAARDHGLRGTISAPYALVPDGTPGISPAVAARVDRIEGVQVAAPVLTTVYLPDGDNRLEEIDGLAVEPAALSRTMRLKVVHGSLGDFGDNSMVVAEQWGRKVGDRVPVHLADGRHITLKVAATYAAPPGGDVAYLPESLADTGVFARDGLARRGYLALSPGTDRERALTAVRTVVEGSGARLTTRDDLVTAEAAYARQLTETRQRSTAVIVVLFCFLAILNTLLMATVDRRSDLAVLRLAGATPRQVLRFFVAESLLVSAVGTALAALAFGVNLIGLVGALHALFGTAPIAVPYALIASIAAVSGMLAVAGTVLPVTAALRRRAMDAAGDR